ncbi:MAG: ROK family protein [Anaerolineae bacterium]|jgi:polyphosphate glucokinase|nr:ROK family protein [Anaerolineae bacterium]MBT4312477.1 ROK family protein [Anaerolineae bacterium]MBT4458735.1 ROK family protein [Anaerolineae bacterium]MBT4842255.1 ROK family protein [Anaerolineae bacterium]MBT6062867.1 ROK family protein [Anaerolineae bacterium]
MQVLGIDIGGSGIKGAPVDIEKGEMLRERYRIPTPQPAKPKAVAKTVAEIAKYFEWEGPIGCGFPSVVQQGVTRTAANVHTSWIGTDAAKLFSEVTGCPVNAINDADAAGLAEMTFGAGQNRMGVVLLVTIGTGLGTSIFTNGILLPNTELGHIEIDCEEAELMASDAIRKQENLSWKKWGKRLDIYLDHLEKLVWPDLIILGGGVSKKHEKFMPYLNVQAEIVIAETFNQAGIIGAALAGKPF